MKGAAKEMGGIANKLIYLPTDGWVMGGNAPRGRQDNGPMGQQGSKDDRSRKNQKQNRSIIIEHSIMEWHLQDGDRDRNPWRGGFRWPGKLNDWRNILHTTTMGLWTFAQRPTSCSAHYRPGNNSN